MKLRSLLMLVIIVATIVVVNAAAARHPFRWDLTQHRIYTLAPATRDLLSRLDDVVTFRVSFSRELPPELQGLRRDVVDLLAEFKDAAGARVQVEHLDPAVSAAEEQKAQLLGILPVQLNVYRGDRAEVAKLYLGLMVLYAGKQQVIPFVRDATHLEYQLAEAIASLTRTEMPAIGWWESGETPAEGEPRFRLLREALGRRYAISEIGGQGMPSLDPARLKAVALLSPRGITEEQLFALDQYLLAGGHVLALVDRVEVGPGLKLAAVDTKAFDWLASYGVEVEDALVLDGQNALAAFAGNGVTYHLPYPFWPEVRSNGFDRQDPAAAELDSAVFPWTAALTAAAWAPLARETAVTTDGAAAVERRDLKLDPTSAAEALKAGEHRRRALALTLPGPFRSYFAAEGRRPPRGLAAKLEGAPDARLFVVGSSRWANDRFLQLFPQNAMLFENVLDAFAMEASLIGIRSRESASRPIVDLSDAARLALRSLNMAIGPVVLGIIAICMAIARRIRLTRIISRYQS